jgi:hypothetical protein
MDTQYSNLKTVPGISDDTIYVVVAEDDNLMVAVKPECGLVYFDQMRRFFQIGFRIHVRPQEGKTLPDRAEVETKLGIGHLSTRSKGTPRYVGSCRIPACNVTLSPWVVQDHIAQDHLIERLVGGMYERLAASGLKIIIDMDAMIEMARERFLDMIPDNKVSLPESKVYFGKESYYPPQSDGPPKPKLEDELNGDTAGEDE